MYANVRGMKSKITSLTEILNEKKPHIFLLTETLLRTNTGIHVKNYTFYGRKREGKLGGGVGILVRNDLRLNTAPHISSRDIEIMWVSVRRKWMPPLLIGIYYGKQESRVSKNEIENEMQLLNEEIEEMEKDGNIVLAMDANAKIGLLGEEISRNGHALLQTFENTDLSVMNNSSKCKGKVTRKNTKNDNEISAIDFIVADGTVEQWIKEMDIDEEGLYKVKGKNDSDHNTITVTLQIENLDKTRVTKQTIWNIKAPIEKWQAFSGELEKRNQKANKIITDSNIPIDDRYGKWFKEIDQAARNTIGKTTIKSGGSTEKTSNEIKELQNTKCAKKKEIRNPDNTLNKTNLISEYKDIQNNIHKQIVK